MPIVSVAHRQVKPIVSVAHRRVLPIVSVAHRQVLPIVSVFEFVQIYLPITFIRKHSIKI